MKETKDKADELIEKFANCELYDNHKAVLCAIILCDEMLKDSIVQNIGSPESNSLREQFREEWQDVKTELLIRKQ